MVRRSWQQCVPVVDTGGIINMGFDKPKIGRFLGLG
jgi:hypothetical protein